MMDRNREVRRGPPMANGLLRRRPQRNGGGTRDSPEEGVAGEMPESASARLRDRKKDRLNRSKRRRGERLHGNREEGGEESSEESVDVDDDEDDDDDEESATAQANHRRTVVPPLVTKMVKQSWKVPDEMIGVPVPRKARSAASMKRSHETSISGCERCPEPMPVPRPPSTSPATPSPAAVSPSSSNASIRRRVKPIGAKQKPAKASKVSVQEEIEIEVAEVLFGLRQHPTTAANPEASSYTSSPKVEVKEEESSPLAGKHRSISPQKSITMPRISSPPVPTSSAVAAHKRKRPRPAKSEEEKSGLALSGASPVGTPVVIGTKSESEKIEVSSSPRQGKDSSMVALNGVDGALKAEISQSAVKLLVPERNLTSTDGEQETKGIPVKEEKIEPKEVTLVTKLDIVLDGSEKGVSLATKTSEGTKEAGFQIDLMAPPSKSMMDLETTVDSAMEIDKINTRDGVDTLEKREEVRVVERPSSARAPEAGKRTEAGEGCEAPPLCSERMLDLRLEAEKSDVEGGKQQNQRHSKAARPADPKAPEVEKHATSSSGAAGATVGPSSLALGMHLTGWPGGLPPIGYIGQPPANWPGGPPLHAMVPVEGNPGAGPTLQPHLLMPQPRYKRCATHCYIAQMINYHQQLARMNPYWAAANNTSLFGAKTYNLNSMPSSDGRMLGNALPGGAFPVINFAAASPRAPVSGQEKLNGAVNLSGHTTKEKASASLKQAVPQQPTHSAAATSLPGAAVLFPLNQAAEAGRQGGSKAAPMSGHAAGTTATQAVGTMGSSGPVGMATVNYNFANLPTNDAQYIAMVQGSGFPFPIPAHMGVAAAAATAASAYRGGSAQGVPQVTAAGAVVSPPQQFFNGSFYASHMLHPAQVQQVQSQTFQQQGQPNPANSSGSSSSQKHHQQQQCLQGSGNSNIRQTQAQPPHQKTQSQSLGNSLHPNHRVNASSQPRPGESEPGHGTADVDSTTLSDGKIIPPLQKSLYTPNNHLHQTLNPGYGIGPVAVPMIMSAAVGSGKNGDKQPETHLHYGLKGVEMMPSQAFAMSFAPGVDFSMPSAHHAVLQSLPESYRQNYQLSSAQASAMAAAAQQHAQRTATFQKTGEDTKNTTDSVGGPPARQEDRKAGGGKQVPPNTSHSLTFSRQPENHDNPSISIFNSASSHVSNQAGLENTSRTINPISNPGNSISASRTPSGTAIPVHQQQQHQPTNSHPKPPSNNTGVPAAISYTDRLVGSKFLGSLTALPPGLVQGGVPPQSPQWRSTTGGPPSARGLASVSAPSPTKQTKNLSGAIGPGSSSTAPTQISFGGNAMNSKVAGMPIAAQISANLSSMGNPSVASTAGARLNSSSTMQVGSSPTSMTKSSGAGSTRVLTGNKGVVVPAGSPTISQQNKSTPSSAGRKTSPPIGGRGNLPSILGNPQSVSSQKQPLPQQQPQAQPSNLKNQQQISQQHQKMQAQMLFANTYLPAQSLPPLTTAAATAGYYQARPMAVQSLSNQQQRRATSEQQHSSSPQSSSPAGADVSLGPSTLASASDSSKSGVANSSSLKSNTGSLPSHPFSTPSSSGPTNPAIHPHAASPVMAGFPYIHGLSTAPLKSGDRTPQPVNMSKKRSSENFEPNSDGQAGRNLES